MRRSQLVTVVVLVVFVVVGTWAVLGTERVKQIVGFAPAEIELSKDQALKLYAAEVNAAVAQQELMRARHEVFIAHGVTPDKYQIDAANGKLVPIPFQIVPASALPAPSAPQKKSP